MHANLNFEKNEWKVGPDETFQVLNPKEKKLQEYLEDDEDKTNWRSIIFALAVISTVMAAVLVAVFAMGPLDGAATWFNIPLTLEDALREKDMVETQQIHNTAFLGDSVSFLDAAGGISIFNALSKETKCLVPSSVIRQLNIRKYHPSLDQRFVLLLHDNTHVEGGWRGSYHYSIFITRTKINFPLQISPNGIEPPLLQHAEWAGNSSQLLFVLNNDIFYREDPEKGTIIRLTHDGSDVIFNGVPDWLYHESLDLPELLWPSASGEFLMFGRIDTSAVDGEEFVLFGHSSPKTYQKARSLRYPKAGTTIPHIHLVLLRLRDKQIVTEIFPSNITGRDSYLRSVVWTDDTTVTIAWTSRAHNVSSVIACSAPEFDCQDIYVERTQTKNQWLAEPVFIPSPKGEDEIVFIDEVTDNKGAVSNQILHIRSPEHRATPLRHEGVSVVSLIGWDEERNIVYFTGAPDVRPYERHIYRISDANGLEDSELYCMTCLNETVLDDETLPFFCAFYDASLSASYNFMIAECLGPTVPYTSVYSLDDRGSIIKEINKYSELRRNLTEGILWRERRYVFDLVDGSVGHVQILLPLKWKDSIHGRILFPLIIEVSDHPEEFQVGCKWRRGWDMHQALGLQVAYARFSGRERRHTRGAILLAAQDITTMIKSLLQEVRFIDESRISVWGRGIGGYVAAATLASARHEVSCAIAIAPVSDWLSNDAASSERYIGPMTEAYNSYVLGDLTRIAQEIPQHSFLLVHGSFADPVHMQQSMSLAKALTRTGVQFEQQIYPDTDYRLSMAEKQIYITMNDFLQKCNQKSYN